MEKWQDREYTCLAPDRRFNFAKYGLQKIYNYLNIDAVGRGRVPGKSRDLNGYQKRLIHQLVRAEFPGYVTVPKGGFIQIISYDQKREDKIKEGKEKGFLGRLGRAIGIRWMFEAMIGGDLSKLDPNTFVRAKVG